MGRPNLAETRTIEILDAFERCVATYGLEGSSLERVAEEAKMKRSILRHYVGNRRDLIQALTERVVMKYKASLNEYLEATAGESPVKQLLGFLFPNTTASSTESVMVVESLIAAADTYPEVSQLMTEYIDGLTHQSAALLKQEFAGTSHQKCWSVAYGLICLCFNQESLTPLQLPAKYTKAAKSCAEVLIDSLRE